MRHARRVFRNKLERPGAGLKWRVVLFRISGDISASARATLKTRRGRLSSAEAASTGEMPYELWRQALKRRQRQYHIATNSIRRKCPSVALYCGEKRRQAAR